MRVLEGSVPASERELVSAANFRGGMFARNQHLAGRGRAHSILTQPASVQGVIWVICSSGALDTRRRRRRNSDR